MKLIPDAKGFVIFAIFALAFTELAMIGFQPALAENKLFFALSTATWTGGVLLVATFFFGSSSGSAAKDATIATMAAQTPPAATSTVTVTQPVPLETPKP